MIISTETQKLCLSEHLRFISVLNKIKQAFDVQYEIVILTLLANLLNGLVFLPLNC